MLDSAIPLFAYLFLLGRILGLGVERPLVKRLGQGRDPIAVATLFVGLGLILFALLMVPKVVLDPRHYFADITDWLPLALLPSLLYALSFHLYVWAFKRGDVSLLTPLYASGFVFMYLFDLLNGYAELHWLRLTGVLLVTLGLGFLTPASSEQDRSFWAVLRSRSPLKLLRQPGAAAMLLCALIVAANRMFESQLTRADAEPLQVAFVLNTGPVLAGLLVLGARRQLSELSGVVRGQLGLSALAAFFGHGAYVLMLLALPYFPSSVIEPVGQLSVFIAVALGGLWFHEPVRTRWLPSALVVLGAMLLLWQLS